MVRKFIYLFLACFGILAIGNTKGFPFTEEVGTLIIGGEPAVEGEFPYQISVERTSHVCGGALILVNNTQFVVTSAQCVTPGFDDTYTVVAGQLTRSIFSGHEQRRQIILRIIHEDHDGGTLHNDIALLVLDQPFDLNEWVQPIPLPQQGQIATGEVVISGWGYLENAFNFRHADTLHKVRVPIIDDDICREIYDGRSGTIFPEMTICAGAMGGGKGICHGDLGGPIKSVEGGYLAGIVSGGSPAICALRGQPNVNMEVSNFVSWIQNQANRFQL